MALPLDTASHSPRVLETNAPLFPFYLKAPGKVVGFVNIFDVADTILQHRRTGLPLTLYSMTVVATGDLDREQLVGKMKQLEQGKAEQHPATPKADVMLQSIGYLVKKHNCTFEQARDILFSNL